MFLRNLSRGEAYSAEAPTLWDVDYQTAVAQAEMEDRERPGAYHRLRFDDIEIDTTRPELVAACVALVAHPDDERFSARFGTTVRTPLFGVEVPMLAHPLADPEKGSGIAMICTFGDVTDVVWWRELQLPTRVILTRSGESRDAAARACPTARPGRRSPGRTVKARAAPHGRAPARESGELIGEPEPIVHPVKFYEKGRPAARDRDQPTVVHQQRLDATQTGESRSLRAGRELRLAPALHAGALRALGARV